ncbi:TonB-linked outer membrane protein, SusC/RagA family [Chitinophaga terrae (ex Kim and Jung 2007)]|uniref:TonB-linked outer membrane protein, SusC/RagA family n=1 Tax=Chitinophaga terrae (ex Kim and Jung 2007) TaxID=408074 RepID=A0A1H4GB10_9BACT|nr:SusC/RagA family TonB-linked outer membrane protein [Chitinophaga terrae (ex Kim and Jung 2007)]GEP93185.1 SusC/RagA family TonB-linked outer membrane protein [Chitinophaga terrae (ex Kim and Jung 2007)]SEB06068.1 TonB-linked outer membrane protein, SusC/RagA family [Chitinophaga terrae (ex Kim and Jung 2007)]
MHFIVQRCMLGMLISGAVTAASATPERALLRADVSISGTLQGMQDSVKKPLTGKAKQDSIRNAQTPVDTNTYKLTVFRKQSLDMQKAAIYPFNSLQQMLKGEVAGVYVQEPSGEPGTEMGMMIRGTAIPLVSHKDVYNAQPLVLLNGIPLTGDHPFAFDVKLYDYNRMGPATNLLAAIDPNNIASIEVLKDYADAAIYGPRAANGGVISIKTKAPVIGGRKISFNSWVGISQKPHISTTNAQYENAFRQPYYNRYATLENIIAYPTYLRDSANSAYYGPANWTDLYYRNKITRGVNASLSSGTQLANFRFAAGNEQTQNPGDNTRLDRYNAMFEINMVPVPWLTMSTMINATRLERRRNRSLRDRFEEMQYLPDLTSPLAPNKAAYAAYLDEFNQSFDNNRSNVINGYFRLKAQFSKDWSLTSSMVADYNEGTRDLFFPGTLLETVNYVSNYFGYNQRVGVNNTLSFQHLYNNKHTVSLEAGQVFEADYNRYNYSYAYNGPNDLIKLNQIVSDPNSPDYTSPKAYQAALIAMFVDKQRHRLVSFYGKAGYKYRDVLDLMVLVRADGSSSAQPDNWWYTSPTFSVGYNLKKGLMADAGWLNDLRLHASYGRIARLMTDDRFGEGSQYASELSYNNNPYYYSYNGLAGLSRPYNSGYIGNGIKWPYSDQLDLGFDASLAGSRLNISLDVYNKSDNNMLMNIPGGYEYGYTSVYQNGMKVRNRGADLAIQANVLPGSSSLQWIPNANLNYNQNTLLALPGGIDQMVIGSGVNARLLKVGNSIDQFWLLENKGIYNRERDIPVDPKTQRKLNYKSTPVAAGDPVWRDVNGDYSITDDDKVMKGHYLPKVSGGFGSDLTYRNFTFSFSFYFALGKQVLNQEMANKLDFINHEGQITMDAIKEITFWQKTGDYNRYPLYNPWSKVVGYRADQDLFLEDGSFLKLRNVSLQYDLTKIRTWSKRSPIHGLTIYGTASNLFTITPYTGGDPELIYFNGVDNGYGQPIPKSYTVGVKMDF